MDGDTGYAELVMTDFGARLFNPLTSFMDGEKVTSWYLRCKRCGNTWLFLGSYDLTRFESLYHYCRVCQRNTFHEVVGTVETE